MSMQTFRVAKALFVTDMKIFTQQVKDKSINFAIWMSCMMFIQAYLFPKMGMGASFGLLSLAGMYAGLGVFESFAVISNLTADLEGDKVTHYYATLPLPTWMMFMRQIVSYAVICITMLLMMIPLGKLILWHDFDWAQTNWLYLATIAVVSNIYFGGLALFASSLIKGMHQLHNVFVRIIFPLWFLGGISFTWQTLYATTPVFAYIDLLNPMIYISEAYRCALMGPEDLLPFWVCIGMTSFFACLMTYVGISRLRKRLDFI